MKVIVTQEILDLNPELVEQGVQIGEEIELGEPSDESGDPLPDNETNGDPDGTPPGEGGPGGTKPPKP